MSTTEKRAFIDFDDVKATVSWEEAITKLGLVTKKRSNGEHRCSCPAHPSKDPTKFVITPGKAFRCQQAGRGGWDVIQLAAHVLGVGQYDGAAFLVGKLPVQGTGSGTSTSTLPQATVPEEKTAGGANPLSKIAERLQAECVQVQDLGIKPEVAKEWGIGFSSRGALAGRVLFPISDFSGTVKAYTGLSVDDREPRWEPYRDSDPSPFIFGAHMLEEGDEVELVSDPLQVVLAYQTGNPAIAFFVERKGFTQVEALSALIDQKKLSWL